MPIDLDDELVKLRRDILRMGAIVEQRVVWSLDALCQHDVETARRVRERDSDIDDLEVRIEQDCLRILALSKPVASDLRFVLAVMRINTGLERVGDLAKSIAKRTIHLESLSRMDVPPSVSQMCERTLTMLAEALLAFSNEDRTLAQRVRSADQRVDDLQREVFVWGQAAARQRPADPDAVLDLLSVSRHLERISDHCTNIAEDVIFLVEGSIVRHRRISEAGDRPVAEDAPPPPAAPGDPPPDDDADGAGDRH